MVFAEGKFLDTQIDDGDPEMSAGYVRCVRAARVVSRLVERSIVLPTRALKTAGAIVNRCTESDDT